MQDAARPMDRMYRHQRHFYDATRKFYLLGRDRLIADINPPARRQRARNRLRHRAQSVARARQSGRRQAYGIDVSSEMLATARRSIEGAGLQGRIRLAQADATAFDPANCSAWRLSTGFSSHMLCR